MSKPVSFKELPYITYGTTRLGDESTPLDLRVKVARQAMATKLWFHTSHQYGDTLRVLNHAFKEAPGEIPKLMIKIGGESVEQMRADIQKNIQAMGVPGVEVGQLCPGGAIADELAHGGPAYEGLLKIKREGLVKSYVLEVFPWTSETAYQALKGGHLAGTVDALIFYFNPLQRFASNKLWDLVQERDFPLLALRTVGGGDVRSLAADPANAWMRYWHDRAKEILPVFEASGVKTWQEFCVRFAASYSGVVGTIGASGKIERVKEWMALAETRSPLPQNTLDAITALQRQWSDDVDMKAKPWTM